MERRKWGIVGKWGNTRKLGQGNKRRKWKEGNERGGEEGGVAESRCVTTKEGGWEQVDHLQHPSSRRAMSATARGPETAAFVRTKESGGGNAEGVLQ